MKSGERGTRYRGDSIYMNQRWREHEHLRIVTPLVLAGVFLLGVATPAWAWNEE